LRDVLLVQKKIRISRRDYMSQGIDFNNRICKVIRHRRGKAINRIMPSKGSTTRSHKSIIVDIQRIQGAGFRGAACIFIPFARSRGGKSTGVKSGKVIYSSTVETIDSSLK
jgi:hypothetical protein